MNQRETYEPERLEQPVSGGWERPTPTVVLYGGGTAGRGEDVTYDIEDHDALAAAAPLELKLDPTRSRWQRGATVLAYCAASAVVPFGADCRSLPPQGSIELHRLRRIDRLASRTPT